MGCRRLPIAVFCASDVLPTPLRLQQQCSERWSKFSSIGRPVGLRCRRSAVSGNFPIIDAGCRASGATTSGGDIAGGCSQIDVAIIQDANFQIRQIYQLLPIKYNVDVDFRSPAKARVRFLLDGFYRWFNKSSAIIAYRFRWQN